MELLCIAYEGMSENVEACDVTFILTLDVVSLYLNLFMFLV